MRAAADDPINLDILSQQPGQQSVVMSAYYEYIEVDRIATRSYDRKRHSIELGYICRLLPPLCNVLSPASTMYKS